MYFWRSSGCCILEAGGLVCSWGRKVSLLYPLAGVDGVGWSAVPWEPLPKKPLPFGMYDIGVTQNRVTRNC